MIEDYRYAVIAENKRLEAENAALREALDLADNIVPIAMDAAGLDLEHDIRRYYRLRENLAKPEPKS